MDQLADEELMAKVQGGQYDASGLLYQRYRGALTAYFLNCTYDKFRSEDLVQITFEKMIRYRKNFSARGSFRSWLFTIARNVMIDHWRKEDRQSTTSLDRSLGIADQSRSGEEMMIQQDRKTLLTYALNRLPKEKREMLAMVKLQDMKYREVAEFYDMKESTLKVNIFRTMKELKKHLQDLKVHGY